MKPKLIILRGNSGSGKSTTARELRMKLGYGTALVEQDYIRRTLLREKDKPHQPNIELIRLNVQFALDHGFDVVLEGILNAYTYGDMLRQLISNHVGDTFVYYFDISLDETLKRHGTKSNSHEFGEKELREWYAPKDILGVENERIIPETSTFQQTVDSIFKDIS